MYFVVPAPYIMWTLSSVMFIMSTFILTAPYTMRYRSLRVLTMYTFHYLLCGFGGDANYMVGTNINGYLFHLTAERALRYGYVSPEEMEETSFSIVRNPYSRVVSMYHYNRRFYESFHHFVKDFHARCMEKYHLHRQTDSIDVYCHVLPMHAYTHFNGKKLVNTIIKQEDLKRFVANGWKDSGVPIAIQKALTGIPHANKRPRKISWQKYYTQEIMDMVIDMYEKDFELFGYSKLIPTRPDLRPSKIIVETPELQELSDPTEIPVLPQPQVGLEAVEHPQNGSETDHYFLQKKDHDNVQYPLKDDAGLGVKAKAKKQRKAKVGSAGAIYEEQPMAEQNELRQT